MVEKVVNLSHIATLIIIGFAGGVSGYIFRRLQMSEDAKDTLRVRTLPSIYAATNLYLQSVEQFKKENLPRKELLKKFDDIEATLKKQIFELGGVALLKKANQKNLFDFYFHFSLVAAASKEGLDESDLRIKFREEVQEIGGISTGSLRKLSEQVRLDVLNELKEYRKLPYLMVLIFGLLGIVSAVIAFLE